MRIIVNELKKMWKVKILVIIIALCAAYFAASLHGWIRVYPRGTWFSFVDIAHHLTEHYGSTLEQEEFESFIAHRETILDELDVFIQANALFSAMEIFSFNDLQDARQRLGLRYDTLSDEERSQFHGISLELGYIVRTERYGDLVSENETPEAYLRLRRLDDAVHRYRTNILGDDGTWEWGSSIDSFMQRNPLNEQEYQRLTEIRDSGELLNIVARDTVWNTWQYTRSLAVLVILITLILVSPLVTTDRANRVNWLQYSSKQGRNILKKQYIAVLLSAVGMTTILVTVFIGVFMLTTEVYAFWNNGINSFLTDTFHWLSVTFGQYMLLMVGVMYVLSIGSATFAFVLSRFSPNMIRLMFKVIPFFIAALMLSNWVLDNFLAIHIGGNLLVQISSLLVSLAFGGVIALIVLCREKRVEIV